MLGSGLENPIKQTVRIKRTENPTEQIMSARCAPYILFARPLVGNPRLYNRIFPKVAGSFLLMIFQIPDRQYFIGGFCFLNCGNINALFLLPVFLYRMYLARHRNQLRPRYVFIITGPRM